MGDSADGFPGLRGFGPVAAGALIGRYGRIQNIPPDPDDWDVEVRSAERLAETLRRDLTLAYRFRDLATLRTGARLFRSVEDLRWTGPRSELVDLCDGFGAPELAARAAALASARSPAGPSADMPGTRVAPKV